jgi:hypothetical protein
LIEASGETQIDSSTPICSQKSSVKLYRTVYAGLDTAVVSSKSTSTFLNRKRKRLDSDSSLSDTVVKVKKEMRAKSAVCKEKSQCSKAKKCSTLIRNKINRNAVASAFGGGVVQMKKEFVEEEDESDGSTVVLSEETYFDLTVSDLMNPVILMRLLKQSSLDNLLRAKGVSNLVESDACEFCFLSFCSP